MASRDTELPRVALYARVSTGEGMQADGFSIAAQFNEMGEYATAHHWQVVGKFADVGNSGSNLTRPQLNVLKVAAAEKTFDILLVHELSRLSRSVYDTFALFEYLGRHQIGFASVNDPEFDLSSPNGRFLLGILASVNQYYIDLLKLHTRKAKRQRAREGLYNSSVAPYGYHHTGDARTPPVIEPEEAAVVRLAFSEYATGRYSYQSLADQLNSLGHQTRTGRRFSKDTLADMIRNRFYTGMVVYKQGQHTQAGEVFDGEHEALVSLGLWEACRQVRARHHNAARSTQPQVHAYLLGQLVHCHLCQRRLRSQHASNYSYYREMSNARGFDDCPHARRGTRVDPLHAQMDLIIPQLQLPPDWQAELEELIGEDEEVTTLNNQRARLVAQRRRIKEDRIYGVYDEDPDLYQQHLARIRRQLATLPSREELACLEQAAQQLTHLAQVWEEATEKEKSGLLRLMLHKVSIDVPQSRVLALYPAAAFIPLLRNVPLLAERQLGTFVPIWPPELADQLPYPQQDPLTAVPADPPRPPFLLQWPWPPKPRARITPAISALLKKRRQRGAAAGQVLDITAPGVPPVRLDQRTWPEITLSTGRLADLEAAEPATFAVVNTSFVLQTHPNRLALAAQLVTRLEPQGYWYATELVPTSMPSHWLFTFFPATWEYVRSAYWSTYDFFNQLKTLDFKVELTEHTVYQAVSWGTLLTLAQRRAGLLQRLAAEPYAQGLAQLRAGAQAAGAETLHGSEFTLLTLTAQSPVAS
ncbi:MAG: recombinase family protein [Chloroflexota bacterium]|nr:recombinase family protein [Chloroflexota bacterium]